MKRTSHAVYDLKYHIVWIPKYRKMILKGDLAKRLK
ncbi:MAG: transposase, partial [Thermodesulfobacteriota bacterium]